MKYEYIFGPVPSRRLGVSLGIDLFKEKTCNFNCVYCECGKTNSKSLTDKREEYVDAEIVLKEIRDYLKNKPYLDYITFAGNGEPMLHSKIRYIVKEIKKMTDVKVALITNGACFKDEKIIDEIIDVDLIMPSLDAVSDLVYRKINRPVSSISIESVISGLINLKDRFKGEIYLEVFIIDGMNNSIEELDKLKDVIIEIKPDKVQLNSLARPGAESWVKKASIESLEKIKSYWNLDNVEIVMKYKNRNLINNYSQNSEELILNMISIRSCKLEDLQDVSGLNKTDLNKYLDILEKENKIKSFIGEDGVYIKKI